MNKIALIIMMLLSLVGCRSRKAHIEKIKVGAEVEKVDTIKMEVTKEVKKDSVVQQKKVQEKKDSEQSLRIEFDPKKDDSLEVVHVIGPDSLHFKAVGNGKVTLEYRSKKSQAVQEDKAIFGSQTLYNIDSMVTESHRQKSKFESQKKTKDVKSSGPTVGSWITYSVWFIVAAVLIWLFIYLRGRINLNKFSKK